MLPLDMSSDRIRDATWPRILFHRQQLSWAVTNKRSDDDMDKDGIAGAAKETKGAIKETAGEVLGDSKLTAEGKAEKAEGKVQNAAAP